MKQVTISYDTFNKIMNLIIYLEKSTASILNLFVDTTRYNECYHFQIRHYKKVLIGIHDRAQKIKIEWINAASEQKLFSEKMVNISTTYENIQKDFKELYEITENVFEVDYSIDAQGVLIKKIKSKIRNEN